MGKNSNLWADVLLEQDLAESIEKLSTQISSTSSENGEMVLKNKRIRPHQLNKNRKEKPEKPNRDQNSNKISKKQNNKKFVPKLNCPLVKMGQSRSLRTKLEIDETMPLEVLSEEIRFRIWEQKRWMLKELVEEMGPAVAIEIVNEVSEIEKRGGIALENGRRRLPGGVFIHLVRNRTDIDITKINSILNAHKLSDKNKKNKNKK